MSKNPVVNALAAALYIALVSSVMFFGTKHLPPANDTVLDPIAFLSLFSLSAAAMAFIFFYQPVLLFLEGQKIASVKLLVQTLGAFAVITAILLSSLFFV